MSYRDFLLAQGIIKAAAQQAAARAVPGINATASPGLGLGMPDPAYAAVVGPRRQAMVDQRRLTQPPPVPAPRPIPGGGVPQSAMSYPQLVSRGPAYGNQAARVAAAAPAMAVSSDVLSPALPNRPAIPVDPAAARMRGLPGGNQVPDGTWIPPDMAALQAAVAANPPNIDPIPFGGAVRNPKGTLFTVLDTLDKPRQWSAAQIGEVMYRLATNQPPPDWLAGTPYIDQFWGTFNGTMDPRERAAIIAAHDSGGGEAVWEDVVAAATDDQPWYIKYPIRGMTDILIDPTAYPLGVVTGFGGAATRGAMESAARGNAGRAAVERTVGRIASAPQRVMDVTVDAPFNAAGDLIGWGVRRSPFRRALDETPADRSVEQINTADSDLRAYEGVNQLPPEEGPPPVRPDEPTPPDGAPGPVSPEPAPADGLYTIRKEGPTTRVIVAPDGSEYARRELPKVNTFNENVVAKEVEDLNRPIRREQAAAAGQSVPVEDQGWMDPYGRSYDVSGRTNDAVWFGRDIDEWSKLPENKPFTDAFVRDYYDGGKAAAYRQAVDDLSRGGAGKNLSEKALVRATHFAQEVLPSWKRAVAESGVNAPEPAYVFKYGDALDPKALPNGKGTPQLANVVEHALFGTDDVAETYTTKAGKTATRVVEQGTSSRARAYLRSHNLMIDGRPTREIADDLSRMRRDLYGDGALSQNPAAVKERAIRERPPTPAADQEAALADLGLPTQSEAPSVPLDRPFTGDPAVQYAAVDEGGRWVVQAPPGRDLPERVQRTGFIGKGAEYDAIRLADQLNAEAGLPRIAPEVAPAPERVVANPVSVGPVEKSGRNWTYRVTHDDGSTTAQGFLPTKRAAEQSRQRVLDRIAESLPVPEPAPPAVATPTPKGRVAKELRTWTYQPELDDAATFAQASDQNARWKTSTGNRITPGQARTLYVEPGGQGTRGLTERIEVSPRPRRNLPDQWEVRYAYTGKDYANRPTRPKVPPLETLQDALALADELAQRIKMGFDAVPPAEVKQIVSEAKRGPQAAGIIPDEMARLINSEPTTEDALRWFDAVDGPGDTAFVSAGDDSIVGIAHRTGKLDTETYQRLSQPVTYNKRVMRLWEAYDQEVLNQGGDTEGARRVIAELAVDPETRAALTPKERGKAGTAARTALRRYDTTLRVLRENLMFNWARGWAGAIADTIGNAYTLAVNGEPGAIARSLDFRPAKEFLQDGRGKTAVLDNLPGWRKHTTITGKEPPAGVVQLVETRFETGHKNLVLEEKLGKVYTHTPLRVIADPFIRDVRTTMDRNFRYGLYMAKFDQNVATNLVRFRGMVRMRAERLGRDADEWLRQIDELGDAFGGDDVYRVLGDERLARDWRELASQASKDAHQRVNQLLFSYKMSNADNALRRVAFFHYWLSRAFVLHSRTALRNPYLLNAYYRAWQAMEREAEQNGYPPHIRGFIRLMGDSSGMYGLVNPVNVLVPFGMLIEAAPDDESKLDFLRRWGLYLNPLLEMGAASLGWTDRAPDLTGTAAVRRAIRATTNWLNANGFEDAVPNWLGDPNTIADDYVGTLVTGIADKANAGIRWVAGLGGGDPRWVDDFAGTDPNAYETDVVATVLLDQAEAEFGPQAGWTDAQWATYQEAWEAIHLGRDGNDLADAAVEAYADERIKGVGLGTLMPGGILQRYGPRDTDLRDAKAGREKFGTSTPLTPEEQRAVDRRQQATAGSPEDARLDRLQDQYTGIGTERQRALSDGWRAIAYPELDRWEPHLGVTVHGQFIPLYAVAKMDEDARKDLANAWVASIGGTEELDAYRAERSAFEEANPEYAGFERYKDLAFGYEGGVRAFRENRAAANPNFKREMQNQAEYLRDQGVAEALIPEELDNWATSLAGYKAVQGIRNSVYDEAPASTGDQATVDFLVNTTGGGSGGGKKAPKSTAQKLQADLAQYESEAAVFDAVLRNAGIEGGYAAINNPLMRQALDAQFGDLAPRRSRLLELYLAWVATQGPGADTSPEAFAAVYDRLTSEAAA